MQAVCRSPWLPERQGPYSGPQGGTYLGTLLFANLGPGRASYVCLYALFTVPSSPNLFEKCFAMMFPEGYFSMVFLFFCIDKSMLQQGKS